MRYTAILMVLVVLVSVLAPVVGGQGVAQGPNEPAPQNGAQLSVKNVVEGRNFTSVEVGRSTFGILYGTESAPGYVTIFMITPRYLGDADVVDSDGTSLGERPIRSITYSQHTVLSLIEYTDSNDNGLYDATTFSTADTTDVKTETRRMTAHLRTAWELEMDEVIAGDTTYYVFTLTATNVTVHDHNVGTVQPRQVLGSIELQIVLEVTQATSESSIPVYEVTVDGRSNEVRHVKRVRHRTARTIVTKGAFKYNVTIDDWPVHNANNSMILLTNTKVGVAAHKATMRWAGSRVLKKLGATGEARFTAEDDTEYNTNKDVREDSNADGIPESIQAKERVHFADNGNLLANLTWVDDATVDDTPTRVRFSLLKVGSVSISNGSRTFKGVGVLGGFVYPAGSDIFHDPGIEAEGTEVAFEEVLRDLLPPGTLMIQVASGAAIAVMAFVRRRK